MENEDRRRYFRIRDKVHLSVESIAPKEAKAAELAWREDVRERSLLSELDKLNRDIQLLLTEIRHKLPTICKIIDLQNKKFDCLSRSLALKESRVNDELLAVDISAVGLRFDHPEEKRKGDLLLLTIVLAPSLISLSIIGEVQKCDKTETGTYAIAVDYQHIRQHDQEVIIKHVVNKQYETLQARRQSMD